MKPSHILVLGAGGREHALAWRLAADAHAPRVTVAPGNAGLAARFATLPPAETDVGAIVRACRDTRPDLVVVGPESALAAGAADALAAEGVAVFGPTRAAAQLEASKWFAKEVMSAAGVPTARAQRFEALDAARAALGGFGPPWVIKADGLAAGKGVLVTRARDAAERFLAECLAGARFGASGQRVVLEEFLAGEEASVIAICDGERHVLLPAARDHKRAFDGDEGPNTGGMGAFAPARAVDAALEAQVSERIVTPMLRTMAARGTPFRGALYCGLMIAHGEAKVVEFNVRFGDPETQAILPLVAGDFGALLASAAAGRLEPSLVSRRAGAAVTVALVDEGYPDTRCGRGLITGLDEIAASGEVLVFHAGTERVEQGWGVRGGRAAYVTATGATVAAARSRTYAAVAQLGGELWRCRSDIAAGGGEA